MKRFVVTLRYILELIEEGTRVVLREIPMEFFHQGTIEPLDDGALDIVVMRRKKSHVIFLEDVLYSFIQEFFAAIALYVLGDPTAGEYIRQCVSYHRSVFSLQGSSPSVSREAIDHGQDIARAVILAGIPSQVDQIRLL